MAEVLPSPLQYAIGDLGPARRHVARLLSGQMPPNKMAFREIEVALDRCVQRLERIDAESTTKGSADGL